MHLLIENTLKFVSDEEFAKSNKLGMWSMEFDYPWDWRKKN
jgi:endonuclease YncB( thermonuclease family)